MPNEHNDEAKENEQQNESFAKEDTSPPALPENSMSNSFDQKEEPEIKAAEFPAGFWASVDYMLQHPEEVRESLKQGKDLWKLSKIFIIISILMAAIYGAVMGATNLLQNSDMNMAGKLGLIATISIKVPVLYLLTLLIVLPPVYVSNAFMGARLAFLRIVTLLLASTAIAVTALASMASVAFFFSLTSQSYHFIKLLHVLFFMYAGLAGLAYLFNCIQHMKSRFEQRTPMILFAAWLMLYMFVGTQLGWVLRPFIGSPSMEFKIFRPREGNFYENVIESLTKLKDPDE